MICYEHGWNIWITICKESAIAYWCTCSCMLMQHLLGHFGVAGEGVAALAKMVATRYRTCQCINKAVVRDNDWTWRIATRMSIATLISNWRLHVWENSSNVWEGLLIHLQFAWWPVLNFTVTSYHKNFSSSPILCHAIGKEHIGCYLVSM